jgi:predicted Zn-dependent protease
VMSFSSSLAEARAKPPRLCPCCKAMLNQDPDSRSNPP